jgi:hypothetical protein
VGKKNLLFSRPLHSHNSADSTAKARSWSDRTSITSEQVSTLLRSPFTPSFEALPKYNCNILGDSVFLSSELLLVEYHFRRHRFALVRDHIAIIDKFILTGDSLW